MDLPSFGLLQAAIELVETCNYSRAAKRLGIQQPTLTKRIFELEHQVGFQLFTRSTQCVEPTDACRLFVEEAKLSVFHAERALHVARVSTRGIQATLHIGRSQYTDPYLATLVSSIVLPLHPSLDVCLTTLNPSELEQEVLLGKLDLAIMEYVSDHPKLTHVEIAKQPLCLAMTTESSLSHSLSATLDALDGKRWVMFARQINPFLYDNVMRVAQERSVTPLSVRHVFTAEEAAQELYTGTGEVAFLRQTEAWRIARHGLTMRSFSDDQFVVRSSLVARSSDSSRVVSEFTRTLKRKLETSKRVQLNLPLRGDPLLVKPIEEATHESLLSSGSAVQTTDSAGTRTSR